MSTRSLTTVRSRWEDQTEWRTHAHIYRHHDGYLHGHGQWLYDFLKDLKIVNGWRGGEPKRCSNGPGRVAARLVSELQDDGHEPDLMGSDGPCGQEYHYVISILFGMDGGTPSVTVYDGPMTAFGSGGDDCTHEIFNGTVHEYGEFLKSKVEA